MNNLKNIYKFFLVLVVLYSCEKKKDIDTEKPVINLYFADAFPVNCDTLYFGESFILKMRFTDNVELGSFSIDIHNNFDQHSHSTEVTECSFDPKKDIKGLNPFVFIDYFGIPDGLIDYGTNQSITIPTGNEKGNFEPGDYHFFISLTDKEGWSAQKGLSIKILHR